MNWFQHKGFVNQTLAICAFVPMAVAPKFAPWQEALQHFRTFPKGRERDNSINVGVLDSTMKALAKEGQWQWCIEILEDVRQKRRGHGLLGT